MKGIRSSGCIFLLFRINFWGGALLISLKRDAMSYAEASRTSANKCKSKIGSQRTSYVQQAQVGTHVSKPATDTDYDTVSYQSTNPKRKNKTINTKRCNRLTASYIHITLCTKNNGYVVLCKGSARRASDAACFARARKNTTKCDWGIHKRPVS